MISSNNSASAWFVGLDHLILLCCELTPEIGIKKPCQKKSYERYAGIAAKSPVFP